jgi:hypothetical protein
VRARLRGLLAGRAGEIYLIVTVGAAWLFTIIWMFTR